MERILVLLAFFALSLEVFAQANASGPVALTASDMSAARYAPILTRLPFGPAPPTADAEGEGMTPEELAAMEAEMAEIIPEGLSKVKVTLLSRYHGRPAVGFVDGSDGRAYYLLQGQTFEDFTCEEVDLESGTVTLARSGITAELPLWINPVTTNCADVLSYGQPGGVPATLPTKTDWEQQRDKEQAEAARAELMARRQKAREEMKERRRRHAEEMAALSPEERERRLHDINTDLIISGSGPPLPIELDDRDMQKLREAGFEVPDSADGGGGVNRPRGPRRGPPRGEERTQ